MGSCHYLVLLCFLVFLPVGKPDLASEKAALLAFQAAVGRYLRWNDSSPTPCTWQGIVCNNASNIVTEIHLPSYFLSGEIPMGIFGNLTNLQILSLRLNSLSSQLLSDLAVCAQLHNIYLQKNNFSGRIPDSLFKLYNLVRLSLANNNFSGEISPEFNNLTRLGSLYLQYNQLIGLIPNLSKLNLDKFNVSYNNLNSSIPSSLTTQSLDVFTENSLCEEERRRRQLPDGGGDRRRGRDDRSPNGSLQGLKWVDRRRVAEIGGEAETTGLQTAVFRVLNG